MTTATEALAAILQPTAALIHAPAENWAERVIAALAAEGFRIAPPTDLSTLEIRLGDSDTDFADLLGSRLPGSSKGAMHNVDAFLADGTSRRVGDASFSRDDAGNETLVGYEVDDNWELLATANPFSPDIEVSVADLVAIEL